ncbi:AI-2E family transporter [Candidatus Saccharibacteria bacterium]|nr:AI-2E family transporter [Candidatus Saccharibacteria bacterium]
MKISSRSIVKVLSLTVLFMVGLVLVYKARTALIWIGTAFFLAVALNPAVDGLSQYMPRKSRGSAITVVGLIGAAVVAFLIFSFVPPMVSQTQSLADSVPNFANQLVNGHNFISDQIRHYNLVDRVRASQDQITHYVSSAGGSFYGFFKGLFASLAAATTILVLSVFMMMEGPRWIESFWKLVPPNRRAHSKDLVAHMYRAVSGYVNGNLLTSLIAAVATAVILTIMGVPYAIPLGLMVAIADLIPLVGATIGAVIVILVAFFTSTVAGIIVVVFFLIYQQVENHVLQPVIYGKTVEVTPLTVLIAIIMGAAIGGILGALVAIPIAASLQILIRDYVDNYLHKEHQA